MSTAFSAFLLSGPGPWILATAMAVGAAISRATRAVYLPSVPQERYHPGEPPPSADVAGPRSRKWAMVSLWLSCAVLLALGGVVIPDTGLPDSDMLWFLAGATVVFTLAFRFKAVVGAPLFLLAAAVVLAVSTLVSGFAPPPATLAVVRALSSRGDSLGVEVQLPRASTRILRTSGPDLVVQVDMLRFHPYYAFLPSATWYRLTGIGEQSTIAAPSEDPSSGAEVGPLAQIRARLASLAGAYPLGITQQQLQASVRPALVVPYRVQVSGDGVRLAGRP